MAQTNTIPERTPVYLLTGFLGSGKTTVLKRLLAEPALGDTAVIVNEFGEVGLDHLLLQRGEENAVLLDSGCLCCALNDSLAETLSDLFHRRARGEIPPFRRVVVETSGLADPAPPLQTLMSDRLLASRYCLSAVIATVDAVHLRTGLKRYVELRKQIAVADRLLVTKGDLAGEDGMESAQAALQAINASAPVFDVRFGAIDPETLLRHATAEPAQRPDADDSHGHHRDHGEHSHGLVTLYRACAQPVDWASYASAVRLAQTTLGERLLRLKGLLRVGEAATPSVIQGVQHLFSPPEPLESATGRPCGLTFIGMDIGEDEVDAVMAELNRHRERAP